MIYFIICFILFILFAIYLIRSESVEEYRLRKLSENFPKVIEIDGKKYTLDNVNYKVDYNDKIIIIKEGVIHD